MFLNLCAKIITNGISYHGPRKDSDFYQFYQEKKSDKNLLTLLNKHNYSVFIDNFYAYLKIPVGWLYEELQHTLTLSPLQKKESIMYQTIEQPTNYKNVTLLTTSQNPAYIWPFQNYHDKTQTTQFYQELLYEL